MIDLFSFKHDKVDVFLFDELKLRATHFKDYVARMCKTCKCEGELDSEFNVVCKGKEVIKVKKVKDVYVVIVDSSEVDLERELNATLTRVTPLIVSARLLKGLIIASTLFIALLS